MLRQIRIGVFETNSSSVHTLVICTEKDYKDFQNGEKLYDDWEEKLIDNNYKNYNQRDTENYETYEEYFNKSYEHYEHSFTTPSGEKMVAFGYFGRDY